MKTVKAVHANRGIELAYKKALMRLIDEMTASAKYWIKAEFNKNPPEMAQDATPSEMMNKAIKSLAARWLVNFEDKAKDIAKKYITRAFTYTDKTFSQALKESGFSVEFKMSAAMKDALNASISENVALIKSIPENYFQKLEGIVMRSYAAGGDMQQSVKEIQSLYPITKNRAILIARDQNNKATAVTTKARQLEIGITEAIWMHSHAGKNPRQDHVAANGKKYNVAEGCKISGKFILPGQEINCRCTCRSVLPF